MLREVHCSDFLQFLLVELSEPLFFFISSRSFDRIQRYVSYVGIGGRFLIHSCLEDDISGAMFERNFCIIVYLNFLFLLLFLNNVLNTGCLEFSLLLELSKLSSLLYELLSGPSLRLLALNVSQTHTSFSDHFFFVIIHVFGIRSSRSDFRGGVDLARFQLSWVVLISLVSPLRQIKETLVMFNTLRWSSAHNRRDCAPL